MTWVSLAALAHPVPVSVSDAKSVLMAVVDVVWVPLKVSSHGSGRCRSGVTESQLSWLC